MVTKDGSHIMAIPEKAVTYHSVHGAIQERGINVDGIKLVAENILLHKSTDTLQTTERTQKID